MDFLLGSFRHTGFRHGLSLFSALHTPDDGPRHHPSRFAHISIPSSSSSSVSSASSASLLRCAVSIFALHPDPRIHGFASTAAAAAASAAFHGLQNSMHNYNGQLGYSPCTQKNFLVDNSKLLGSCMGYWGMLSSWLDQRSRNTTDAHNDKSSTNAMLGNTNNSSSKARRWTNIFIGINVLMYVAQEASKGKLLLLGAKVNSLIDQGQVWRFLTPAFLHASLPHLMTNCYSLNSIGPIIEAQGGGGRFLAVYLGSALTGFIMSYSFTKAPAVGASGAVFGLVGSLAVFLLRHKDILSGANQDLSNLARMIAINMVLGLSTSKIDNWGHLGGFLGGAVISWVVGPAYSYKRIPGEKKMVLVDRPPLSYIVHRWEH